MKHDKGLQQIVNDKAVIVTSDKKLSDEIVYNVNEVVALPEKPKRIEEEPPKHSRNTSKIRIEVYKKEHVVYSQYAPMRPTWMPFTTNDNIIVSRSFVPLQKALRANLTEMEFVRYLERGYLIPFRELEVYGFPVESSIHEGCFEIYKCLPKHMAKEYILPQNGKRYFRHFYGNRTKYMEIPQLAVVKASTIHCNRSEFTAPYRVLDTGNPNTITLERCIKIFSTPDGVQQIFTEYGNNTSLKQCVRCQRYFQLGQHSEYLNPEICIYHCGKLLKSFTGVRFENIYTCCNQRENTRGCMQYPWHVWNGIAEGVNGPYPDFKYTRPRNPHLCPSVRVYALDCEMSYTGNGLEVTKVSVVNFHGEQVYEKFVQPRFPIVDYNTKYSGVTEKDLSSLTSNGVKSFDEVQQDLLELIDADCILVGHSIDNDLRVLRIVHKRVVDTSLIFPHRTGFPYRRSLKSLARSYLNREIQCGDNGHNSMEDSLAALDLILWKVRSDLKL